MNTVVCTIFEGHYHKGVAGLVNSLYAFGFKGSVWVGYKGDLPPWVQIKHKEKDVEIMEVRPDLHIHFVRFPNEVFLPYSKPEFMLRIWADCSPSVQNLIYIDCDIVLKCAFTYFEEWVGYGVALCEDMESPVPLTSPLRCQWANYFKRYNIDLKPKDTAYVNGGFVGVNRETIGFLKTWQDVQIMMLDELKEVKSMGSLNRTYRFALTDQDALNIAKDLTPLPTSIANCKSMDFSGFGFVMSHAGGGEKPWKKNFLKHVFKLGHRPTMADRQFMNHTETPLSIFTPRERFLKKAHLKIACAVARVMT